MIYVKSNPRFLAISRIHWEQGSTADLASSRPSRLCFLAGELPKLDLQMLLYSKQVLIFEQKLQEFFEIKALHTYIVVIIIVVIVIIGTVGNVD